MAVEILEDADRHLDLLPSLDTVRGRTVYERVLNALRTAVVTGVFPPNSRLLQTNIAQRLGVSVTPVREALRDLASEGLVRMDAHKGAVVAEITSEEFEDVRRLLDALSRVMADLLIMRASDEDVARLEEMQSRIERAPERYLELNTRFHALLREACHSDRLNAMIQSLNATAEIILHTAIGESPQRVQEGIEEHRWLLQAIRDRDAGRVGTLLIEHRRPTWKVVEEILARRSTS